MVRRLAPPAVVIACLAAPFAPSAPSARSAPASITSSSYLSHLRFLSSDELGGRGNGTEGLTRAGDYIAAQFAQAGLLPAGEAGTYFQSFDADVRVEPPSDSALVLKLPSGETRMTVGNQFYPLSIIDRTNGRAEPVIAGAPLVFAGFGIDVPALGYDDYAGLDVRGKAVVVFTHEPQENDDDSVFGGKALTPAGTIAVKVAEAERRGAAMLIVVDDPVHHVDYAVRRSWWDDPQSDEFGIPVLRMPRSRLARVMPEVDFERIGRIIDETRAPQSRPLPGTVSYTEKRAHLRPRLRNVVGVVRGAASGRGAIVIGAHYDHLGLGGRFSEAPEATGTVHNGADDNASGTAAMIEACRAAAAERLSRTVVCVAFAGEEIGLVGSAYYAEHPAVPLPQTLAMINLDMVGRAHGHVMAGFFGDGPARLDGLRVRMRGWTRLIVDDFSRGYAADASDVGSFASKGVPGIAFFTGFHPDYHRPGDDWQKIDAAGGAAISELALRLVEFLGR